MMVYLIDMTNVWLKMLNYYLIKVLLNNNLFKRLLNALNIIFRDYLGSFILTFFKVL